MMNHNFEKKISDKLNQFEIEPSEGLLDSIFEKRAASKKGIVKFPFKMLAGVLGIATIISVAYYFNKEDKNNTLSSEIAINTNAANNVATLNAKEESSPSSISTPINDLKKDNTKLSIVKDKNSNQNLNKFNVFRNVSKNVKNNISTTQNASKSNDFNKINNLKRENKTTQTINYSSENIAERYFNILNKNRPTISLEEHKGKSHLYIYETVSEVEMENKNVFGLVNYGFKKFNINTNTNTNFENIDYVSNLKLIKNRKPIFLDIFTAPSITVFNAKDESDINKYYNQLNTRNYNQLYGFRVTVPVANKISVFSGLNYTEQNSRYKGAITSISNVTTINTRTEYINDPILGTISRNYQDTTYTTVSNTNNYNFTNRYQIFQLPLGLSYNFGFRKFDFAPHIATLFNLYTSSNGKNIDFKTNNTHNFTSNKKQLGIGASISFMTAYRITNKFKFIIEPGVQWYKIKANNTSNKMSENRLNNQLTIGLRYTIF